MRRWGWVLVFVWVVRWTDYSWDAGRKELRSYERSQVFGGKDAADAFSRVMEVFGFEGVTMERVNG